MTQHFFNTENDLTQAVHIGLLHLILGDNTGRRIGHNYLVEEFYYQQHTRKESLTTVLIKCRYSYYAKSMSTFQALLISGDIETNPGPSNQQGGPDTPIAAGIAPFQITVLVRFSSVWFSLVTVLLIVCPRSLLLCPFHKKLRN